MFTIDTDNPIFLQTSFKYPCKCGYIYKQVEILKAQFINYDLLVPFICYEAPPHPPLCRSPIPSENYIYPPFPDTNANVNTFTKNNNLKAHFIIEDSKLKSIHMSRNISNTK